MVQLNASLSIPNYDVENTGTPGPPGEDGKTTYVHIAYANDPTGSLDFSTTDPAGRAYVGMYTDFEILDSSDPSKYTWQKVEGEKGDKGDTGNQGIPGTPGADGKTPYFHTAYAWSADGTDRFTKIYPGENLLLGTLPNNWPTLEGKRATGAATISLADEKVLVTATGNTPYYSAGVFSAEQVLSDEFIAKIRGKRLVASVDVAFVNQLTVQTNDLDISIYYYREDGRVSKLRSRKTIPSNERIWIDALMPEDVVNVLVAIRGSESFVRGASFEFKNLKLEIVDEVPEITPIYTPSPSEDPINAYPSYTGTYSDYTEADSSNHDDYTWVRFLGDKGDDGLTMNFYQAWANSPDGTIGFSTTQSNNKGYLGTYASTETTQSQVPSRYKWTELVGSLVIDSTNYVLESRFNWRPAVVYQTVSSYTIPLSQIIPAGTKIQASSEYYWLSGNKPTVDGVRILMLATDGNTSAGVETNLTTASDSGKIEMSGTLTQDAGFIRVYNGSAGKGVNNRYQFENIVVNIGDRLCPWQPNVRDKVQLNNLLTNSTWQLGGGNWQYNVNQWQIVEAHADKPTSNIAKGLVNSNIYQQMNGQNPHPVKVSAGQIIVVSFDYRESGTVDTFFAVRNFATADAGTTSADAQEEFMANRSQIERADPNGWSRVTMRFVVTKDGFLDFIPYNSSTQYENAFREIMVTTNGSLQGDYAWYQPDYTSQSLNEATQTIPRVFVQSLSPTNIKDGDQWWKMSNNQVTNFYVWGNGQWNEQTIEQSVLNIQTLNAVNINGSVISGSEFINLYNGESQVARFEGFTQLKNGVITQQHDSYAKPASEGKPELLIAERDLTMSHGQMIATAKGYTPNADATESTLAYQREGIYTDQGVNLTERNASGTPIGTASIDTTNGFGISNQLEGGNASVTPKGISYTPASITVNSGQVPFVVAYGTGDSLQNDPTPIRRISFGGSPSYGWGSDPNNSPIEIVYPTNNYLFRITRKCKLYIQYGLRIQGNGASNGADYVYSGFSWGSSIDATNTDANSHVLMWGADTGDSSLNLQNAATGAGYYAFTAGTYLSVVRSIRSGRTLMNCTGLFIRFEEMYN